LGSAVVHYPAVSVECDADGLGVAGEVDDAIDGNRVTAAGGGQALARPQLLFGSSDEQGDGGAAGTRKFFGAQE
jgi:hypothetical protein